MPTDPNSRSAGFRYGFVLAVTSALLVFVIVAPEAPWARAVALGLEGVALTVVIATCGPAPRPAVPARWRSPGLEPSWSSSPPPTCSRGTS